MSKLTHHVVPGLKTQAHLARTAAMKRVLPAFMHTQRPGFVKLPRNLHPVKGPCVRLTDKQLEQTSRLLFDCPVRFTVPDYDTTEEVRLLTGGSDEDEQKRKTIASVLVHMRTVFHAAFGRHLPVERASPTMFMAHFSGTDLESIYRYSVQFRGLRPSEGMDSHWMCPWVVFQLLDDCKTVRVFTPYQKDFLEVCHMFPGLSCERGSARSEGLDTNDLLCCMDYAVAVKCVVDIMNESFEDVEEDGTVVWGQCSQPYHHICWLPDWVAIDTVSLCNALNAGLSVFTDTAERDFGGMAVLRVAVHPLSGRRFVELELLEH